MSVLGGPLAVGPREKMIQGSLHDDIEMASLCGSEVEVLHDNGAVNCASTLNEAHNVVLGFDAAVSISRR